MGTHEVWGIDVGTKNLANKLYFYMHLLDVGSQTLIIDVWV